MADNTVLNAGAGGDTIATDDLGGGVKIERVKMNFGVDGVTVDVSSSNPLPVTGPLTDAQLRALAVPVSGTVTASGPLTDAQLRASAVPVSGPLTDAQLRASAVPISLATNTPDVTDRDARLLGRTKQLDSGGVVIDPAKEHATAASPHSARLSDGAAFYDATKTGQLPTALVGGRLDVNIGSPATLPVSLATNTPDVTDRAAREVGRVRIWDGTDEATVLPIRTVPATTEKVQVTSELPARLRTYQCVTGEVAPAITIGVKELLCFFHPAAVTSDAYIVEIVVSILVTTASTTGGRTNVEVLKVTSAGTGGTNLAAADVGGGLGTSDIITNAAANVMQVKTGGGALGTAFIRQGLEHATQPLGTQRFEIFKASSIGNGIILRGGSADGINIQVNRVVAHTALVDQWTASIRWIEL